MSEQDNVDVVRKGYEAFGRGDIDGLLAQLDPDVTWRTPGPAELTTAGDRRGHAGVREFFQALLGMMDFLRFEAKQFIPSGDLVLVMGDDTTRVKATGTTLETRFVHAFTVRNGKVVAFEEYLDISPLLLDLRAAQTPA